MSATSSQPFDKSRFAKETMAMGSDAAAVDVYVHPALGKIEQVHPLMFLVGLCGCKQHLAITKIKKVMDKEEALKKVSCMVDVVFRFCRGRLKVALMFKHESQIQNLALMFV